MVVIAALRGGWSCHAVQPTAADFDRSEGGRQRAAGAESATGICGQVLPFQLTCEWSHFTLEACLRRSESRIIRPPREYSSQFIREPERLVRETCVVFREYRGL